MEPYRDSPQTTPLIWAANRTLLALDAQTGALRWRVDLATIRRLFRVGDRIFVATDRGVSCLDIHSGASIGEVALPFEPSAGIATPELLIVAGREGAAAVTQDGRLAWTAKQEFKKGFSLAQFIVATDAAGEELWKEEVSGSGRYDHPGLLLGDDVAQPDLDSM